MTSIISRGLPVHWRIFSLLFALGAQGYVQQKSLTIAAARMIQDLGLTQMQIGWLEQGFVLGYTLFQVPGGLLGERYGARWTLFTTGVMAIIAMTATAIAPQFLAGTALFALLLSLQIALGSAQAATFPVSTGVIQAWFPERRWALAQGLLIMGVGLGTAATAPLIAALMESQGWQRALLYTDVSALALVSLWAYYGRSSPRQHPAVAAEPAAAAMCESGASPRHRLNWRRLGRVLVNRHVLVLTLSYLGMSYAFYLLSNWCFLYLVQERHFSVLEGGWLAAVPPLASAVGAGLGGVLASNLQQRYGGASGLRLLPLISLPMVSILLLCAVNTGNPYLAVVLLAVCFACVELTEGSYWAAAMLVGRENSMTVGGIMNTGGNLGGIVAIPIVAYLSGRGAWNSAFSIGAAFALAAALCWVFVEPVRRTEITELDLCYRRADP